MDDAIAVEESINIDLTLEFWRIGRWMLLHDNTPAHRAIHIHQLLAQRSVPVLHQPLYSRSVGCGFLSVSLPLLTVSRTFLNISNSML
jgi:hypothetical protein